MTTMIYPQVEGITPIVVDTSNSPIIKNGEGVDVSLPKRQNIRNCRCSVCGKWNIGDVLELPTFCGHCGIKMSSDVYCLYEWNVYAIT